MQCWQPNKWGSFALARNCLYFLLYSLYWSLIIWRKSYSKARKVRKDLTKILNLTHPSSLGLFEEPLPPSSSWEEFGPTQQSSFAQVPFEMHQLYIKVFTHFISGMLPLNNWPIYFHHHSLLILIKCTFRSREHEPFPFLTNNSLAQCSIGEVTLLQLQLMEKTYFLPMRWGF